MLWCFMAVDWSEAIYCQESSKDEVMAVNVCANTYTAN